VTGDNSLITVLFIGPRAVYIVLHWENWNCLFAVSFNLPLFSCQLMFTNVYKIFVPQWMNNISKCIRVWYKTCYWFKNIIPPMLPSVVFLSSAPSSNCQSASCYIPNKNLMPAASFSYTCISSSHSFHIP
jgi:hypothetical protein